MAKHGRTGFLKNPRMMAQFIRRGSGGHGTPVKQAPIGQANPVKVPVGNTIRGIATPVGNPIRDVANPIRDGGRLPPRPVAGQDRARAHQLQAAIKGQQVKSTGGGVLARGGSGTGSKVQLQAEQLSDRVRNRRSEQGAFGQGRVNTRNIKGRMAALQQQIRGR